MIPDDFYRELKGRKYLAVRIAKDGRAPHKGSGTMYRVHGSQGLVKIDGHHSFELIPLAKLTLWHARNNCDHGPGNRAA